MGTSWSVYLTPAGTTLRPLEVKAQCQWTVTCTIYLGLPLQHCVMHICEVNVSRNHLAAVSSNVLHADADADANADADADADADAGKPLCYFHNGLSIYSHTAQLWKASRFSHCNGVPHIGSLMVSVSDICWHNAETSRSRHSVSGLLHAQYT